MRGVLRGTRVSRLRRCEAGLKPGAYTIQNGNSKHQSRTASCAADAHGAWRIHQRTRPMMRQLRFLPRGTGSY